MCSKSPAATVEKLEGRLTDLTVPIHTGEHGGHVRGLVIGGSEDGSCVYLVATGVLTSVESADHEQAEPGGFNLYELQDTGSGWATTFVAGLSGGDVPDWNEIGIGREQDLGLLTARVSPNGEYLAFMSDRSLTGYDNIDANSGVADEEVFLYGASSRRLVCASCDPTGARPVGIHDPSTFPRLLVDKPAVWRGRWLAGSIPGWTAVNLAYALYQSRYLSNEGRLFFDSADALVPQDTNGKEDVYEYEPEGLGSCTRSGSTFSEKSDGCVGLISSGTSGEESAFVDASETGGDVFFVTAAKLVAQDYDDAFDMYDAHECTSASPCPAPEAAVPPACATADSCKAPPTPQPAIFGAPASSTFTGAGNPPSPVSKPAIKPMTDARRLVDALKSCRARHKKSKRRVCEAQARKKYSLRIQPRSPTGGRVDDHLQKSQSLDGGRLLTLCERSLRRRSLRLHGLGCRGASLAAVDKLRAAELAAGREGRDRFAGDQPRRGTREPHGRRPGDRHVPAPGRGDGYRRTEREPGTHCGVRSIAGAPMSWNARWCRGRW